MLYKEEMIEEKNPFSDWPKAFYEERDPKKREALVLEKIKSLEREEKDAENTLEEKRIEEYRLLLLRNRHPLLEEKRAESGGFFRNDNPCLDKYMFAWMSILISGRTGIYFWNKKSKKKELKELLDIFDFPEEKKRYENQIEQKEEVKYSGETDRNAPTTEKEGLQDFCKVAEWKAFASFWIETCVEDKSYSSTVFGLLRMKDESLAKKMAQDIADALYFIPRSLELLEVAEPLRKVLVDCYCKSIFQGEKYWKEIVGEE